MSSGNKPWKKKQQKPKGGGGDGGGGPPLKCPTEGIVNDADEIRAMVLDAMGLNDESWCSAVEVLDGASYVPGRGLQGVKVTLPLHEADRVTRLYRNTQNAQPLVSRGSVFVPTDHLSEDQFERVRSNATENPKGLGRMASEMLAEHGSDVAQFFAHYGASTDLRHLYKQKAGELREGALCVWSAPEVPKETMQGIENALHEIAVLNTAEFSAEEEGDEKNADATAPSDEPVMVPAPAEECFSASTTRVPRKPTDKLSPEDAKLQTELMTSVRDDIAAMRLKADTFNRAYAYALCTELKIPMGGICDEDEGMLDTHVGCTMSSLGFENGGGSSKSNAVVVATFNVNHSREGSKSALVFHSPESGSTLYEDMGSGGGGAADHHQQAGNNNNTVPSSLGRQRPAAAVARGGGSISREAPAAHGVQVPPLLDSVSDNVYATDTEVAGSFKEDLVHREAWAAAKSARHVAAEFYLSGAPNPVAKGGIANADDLARFLDGLVLPSASASATVFVPDSGDRVCNMVREAHPDNWLDIITRDSAVRDAAGKTVGWRLPVDSLRHAAKA